MTANDSAAHLPDADYTHPNPEAPHPSRTYDAWLGGKDNLAADRGLHAAVQQVFPPAPVAIRSQRMFLERAVKHLVGEQGIRQILDIGSGLPQPTMDNVHVIARRIAPETRVVYVDVNPVAVSHMEALHADGDRVTTFGGDLRDPESILNHPVARAGLDFDRPIGVLLVGIVHFLTDEDDPAGLVARLRDSLPSGSFLVMNQISADLDERMHDVVRVWQEKGRIMVQRSRAQVAEIVTGFEPVEPGIVAVHEWRPDGAPGDYSTALGVVARKP